MPSSNQTTGKKTSGQQPPGLSTAFRARVDHLAALLRNLPSSLPQDPTQSLYQFALDADFEKEEGTFAAFSRTLEHAFHTHTLRHDEPILFTERGQRCMDLVRFFKTATRLMSSGERETIKTAWLERLIRGAKETGATIPKKRRLIISSSEDEHEDEEQAPAPIHKFFAPIARPRQAPATINLVSSESEDDSHTMARTSPKHPARRPKAPRKRKRHVQSGSDSESDVAQPGSSITSKPPPAKQAKLDIFGWKPMTREEAHEKSRKELMASNARSAALMKREEEQRKAKADHKREVDRLRQQRHRAKKTATKKSRLRKASLTTHAHKPPQEIPNLAEISRPHGMAWKAARNGKKGGVTEQRHTRTNWFHPFLWAHINNVAPRVGWSATLIARTLQRDQLELFSRLSKGTVQRWLSKHGKRWSKRTLQSVENRRVLTASGRAGILAKYPDLVEAAKTRFLDMRKLGIPISRVLGRSILLALIKSSQPALLETFKCSEHFVGDFFCSVLGWSVRKGTRAAAHIPANADELCERAFFRIVHIVVMYDVPAALIVGMDQTGVYVLPNNNVTYAETGSRQVDVAAKDEKRAYTLCVATSADGDILPFQQIWSGQTSRSLPEREADGMNDALGHGFHFAFAASSKKTSHFSTLKTMKEWMVHILKPYIEHKIQELNLPDDQKAILVIDCYPVHTSEDFRLYVWNEFPNIFLIFIPANCTGIFQPADIGLNRVIKHRLRQSALEFLVESHTAQISKGLTPEQVKITTSIKTLRDASVAPLVSIYNFFDSFAGKTVIRRAWEKCAVKEWNLSAECITGRKAKAAWREYLRKDETLRKEIEGRVGNLDALIAEDLDEENDEADEPYDDTDVPLRAVVQQALGVDLVEVDDHGRGFCTPSSGITERAEDQGLQSGGDEENIWAYNDAGELWKGGSGALANDGRAHSE
ncbi:hypothetical protein FOMPIDRAFT_1132449 [Fomitopsis schrenkii]|uniref:DDE-1 domain-containing protein n=1 Tax=Fomitopsis schrenkii TaxID=2126942 RepID=S8DRX3_FOMSC|nr:hypothetical protein FOMPIDRAFT_1132449 [Fomitopsis schrenkii]